MILYILLAVGGIFLLLKFDRKRNKFLFAVAVICTAVGLTLVVATLLLVSAASNK
ncbi:MAG: hypothetical protein II857_09790 [Selenomonadaceae bacterium]|nr:hypothetical protein [Selenomonadaceae bacterium]